MARRLQISPEGVNGLLEPSIDSVPTAAGRNDAVVLNDHPEVADDNTYTNIE